MAEDARKVTVRYLIAATRTANEVRCIRHRFHSTGDYYIGASSHDFSRADHRRLETGTTDLVDSRAGCRIRQASPEGDLTGGSLTSTRLQYLTHVELIDDTARGIDCSTLQQRLHSQGAEFSR